jgi:hypothetical protein
MNDGFKVVDFDEFNHMYKLGTTPSSLEGKGFIAMIANVDNTTMLWH